MTRWPSANPISLSLSLTHTHTHTHTYTHTLLTHLALFMQTKCPWCHHEYSAETEVAHARAGQWAGTVLWHSDDGWWQGEEADDWFRAIQAINTSLYLCDNKFHTEALNELLEDDDVFGILALLRRLIWLSLPVRWDLLAFSRIVISLLPKLFLSGECLLSKFFILSYAETVI